MAQGSRETVLSHWLSGLQVASRAGIVNVIRREIVKSSLWVPTYVKFSLL